ncbi:hypothetical protein EG68_02392 [Paragonimus skrjabini miyazakii]|uniref:Uncharacterized protein n=1 Tax=Paragonimus skrjabini miyazakii TaxID=59628 RepID=A0A8S9Z549_9TREM|nr:hypothetical protein EG68_02392 [Paragonimus skrjabini miyazakii]
MIKNHNAYEFEMQKRRILSRYEKEVVELKKMEKTCLAVIDQSRHNVEKELQLISICKSTESPLVQRINKRLKARQPMRQPNSNNQNITSCIQPLAHHEVSNRTKKDIKVPESRSCLTQSEGTLPVVSPPFGSTSKRCTDRTREKTVAQMLHRLPGIQRKLDQKVHAFIQRIIISTANRSLPILNAMNYDIGQASHKLSRRSWLMILRDYRARNLTDFSLHASPRMSVQV